MLPNTGPPENITAILASTSDFVFEDFRIVTKWSTNVFKMSSFPVSAFWSTCDVQEKHPNVFYLFSIVIEKTVDFF